MKAAKKTSRSVALSSGNPFANGTASRKAKRTCTPGSATRSSLSSSISSRFSRCCGLSDISGLFEPGLARETADPLDGAVDRLDDPGPGDVAPARPVRQLVTALLLAVFRIDVHGRLAQARRRKTSDVEPELFDLALMLEMICEDVARTADRIRGKVEAL